MLRVHNQIDAFLVFSPLQADLIRNRWAVENGRVVQLHGAVDTGFFSPEAGGSRERDRPGPRPVVVSVGAEARDYDTLLAAVDGVDADVIIRASSPWARGPARRNEQGVPSNVVIMDDLVSYHDLRQLYARSDCVVVPLQAVEYAAGITTVIEAMAMGKPVVCTATPGRDDALVDGETGLLVAPHDSDSLRAAIRGALEDHSAAQRMGDRARQRAVAVAGLRPFVDAVRRQLGREGRPS